MDLIWAANASNGACALDAPLGAIAIGPRPSRQGALLEKLEMDPSQSRWPLNRRQFFARSTAAAGLLGFAASAVKAQTASNPFAYDVSRLARTDPALVRYEPVSRIETPRAETRRIAIGPDDRLYLAAGNYVSVLDAHGTALNELALRSAPQCLAVSTDGELFVGLRDHVEVYDEKGAQRAIWDSLGSRAWLTGLALGSNSVFIADAGNRIVLRCDREGKILNRIGAKDKVRNIPGFIIPSPFFDLESQRDGLLRVTNPGRHRVEAYTPEGDLEFAWGRPSGQIDGFCGCCNPVNIAQLSDGRIVTCEKGLPRVKIYSGDGVLECVVAGPESFPENARSASRGRLPDGAPAGGLDAAVDSKGRVLILDLVKGDIMAMARKASAPGTDAAPSDAEM